MKTVQKGVPSPLSAPLFFQSNYLSWVNFHGPKGGNLHNLPTAEFGYNFFMLSQVHKALFPSPLEDASDAYSSPSS